MAKYTIPQVKLTYVGEPIPATKIIGSLESARIFRESYEEGEIEYTEHFKVLYLNRANKILGLHEVSKGGTSACIVDVKVIFTGALLANASSIIVCHNHPSGNLCPSIQDDQLTKKLVDAGKLLDLKVLDSLIVTKDSYYSYVDHGRLY